MYKPKPYQTSKITLKNYWKLFEKSFVKRKTIESVTKRGVMKSKRKELIIGDDRIGQLKSFLDKMAADIAHKHNLTEDEDNGSTRKW